MELFVPRVQPVSIFVLFTSFAVYVIISDPISIVPAESNCVVSSKVIDVALAVRAPFSLPVFELPE